MNYGEIKQNIISLGFAEQGDYDEYEELGYTYDSINRAIQTIAVTFPFVAKYEFEIDAEDTDVRYIDMTSVDEGFIDFGETPVLFEKNGEDVFRKFGEYQIEMGHNIVIEEKNVDGSIRIYYKKQPTVIDSETEDTFVPEIPLKVHHLIPLIASYYLWLDDDAAKATQYYNMYETALAAELQNETAPKGRIATEWGGL